MCVVCTTVSYAQSENPWDLFAKATFKDEYIEEYFSYATLLEYDDFAQSLDGQKMTLNGHYIPVMDEEIIILSKASNSPPALRRDSSYQLQSPTYPPIGRHSILYLRKRNLENTNLHQTVGRFLPVLS